MLQTYVRPSRDLRNNYAELSKIVQDHNQVIITHNGKGDSVLISMEDYAQYEEYLHWRYVQQELAKAKEQAADPATQWMSHEDVWRKIEEAYDL